MAIEAKMRNKAPSSEEMHSNSNQPCIRKIWFVDHSSRSDIHTYCIHYADNWLIHHDHKILKVYFWGQFHLKLI